MLSPSDPLRLRAPPGRSLVRSSLPDGGVAAGLLGVKAGGGGRARSRGRHAFPFGPATLPRFRRAFSGSQQPPGRRRRGRLARREGGRWWSCEVAQPPHSAPSGHSGMCCGAGSLGATAGGGAHARSRGCRARGSPSDPLRLRASPGRSLLRSNLPGRGHGGLCAFTTGEPRGLRRFAPARWGAPARSASLSEGDPLAVAPRDDEARAFGPGPGSR
jgi:hypothetical protein